MATKNNPGPIDCYAAAAPDEPIFILRSTDPLAADTVRRWAKEYRGSKIAVHEWDSRTEAKYREALQVADQMLEYYNTHC